MIKIVTERDEVRFEGNSDELRAWARQIETTAEREQDEPAVLRCLGGKRGHIRVVVQKGETVHSL